MHLRMIHHRRSESQHSTCYECDHPPRGIAITLSTPNESRCHDLPLAIRDDDTHARGEVGTHASTTMHPKVTASWLVPELVCVSACLTTGGSTAGFFQSSPLKVPSRARINRRTRRGPTLDAPPFSSTHCKEGGCVERRIV